MWSAADKPHARMGTFSDTADKLADPMTDFYSFMFRVFVKLCLYFVTMIYFHG